MRTGEMMGANVKFIDILLTHIMYNSGMGVVDSRITGTISSEESDLQHRHKGNFISKTRSVMK